MNDVIYDKTTGGREELRTRAEGLPQRVRSVLIMVDGARPARELREAVQRLGAPNDTLESLAAMGLIAPTRAAAESSTLPDSAAAVTEAPASDLPAEQFVAAPNDPTRFRTAKKFMNDTIVDALGFRAFLFTLKLEKCATLADLANLAPEHSRLLLKAKGGEVAGALRARLRELLR
jgi:hypothetical protein